MKIVFDCRYTRIGRHDGISRYGSRLVEELSKLHPVTMLISDRRQLDLLPDLPWELATSPTAASEPFVAFQVNKLNPDVVFTPMQTMGPYGRKYALVTTVHDLIYYKHPAPPHNLPWAVRVMWRIYHLTWAFQRGLLNRADAHVTDAHTTRDQMREHRLTTKPISVVSLGTDSPARYTVRTVPTSRELVYMGSYMPYKNVELIARALHDLPGYTLHLMSRADDAVRARLTALAPESSLIFHDGASDEVYTETLSRATALVSASRDEGFGLPQVEAMVLGTPVLLSDIPIFREISGPAGGFFDPDDPAALAREVKTLADPAVWQSRSTAARTRSEEFTWAKGAAGLLDVLTDAVVERRKSRARR
ncbi:glycosyltransferase involved in cell wall biosynthesis [Rhodoglobus vestalii]|uniref:Glycosyltransferase involved in cell wall biosynthesis n=1 Tax=Rhodoglobus vestalii TaxID=193384 RepID=A0A8H2PTL5_9MICO|nr:glycosyltransferase family 1 protein [Rhodoglobus vestalii]TQO18652.1 glycosyltransferase involved in cell wall biosynthesis [Rhodoglobus vestalii]